MKLKSGKEKKDYRLYGCHFTEKEYQFINQKIKETNENRIKKISNTEIILELFRLALKEEENRGENE